MGNKLRHCRVIMYLYEALGVAITVIIYLNELQHFGKYLPTLGNCCKLSEIFNLNRASRRCHHGQSFIRKS